MDPSSLDLSAGDERPTEIIDTAAMLGGDAPGGGPEAARTVMMMAPDLAGSPGPAAAAEALPTPTLAELYMEQGLPSEAEKVYVKLLEGDPDNAEIREKLARLRGDAPCGAGSARARIRALEDWLATIRRARDAQGRA
jgi:hypothetical protein